MNLLYLIAPFQVIVEFARTGSLIANFDDRISLSKRSVKVRTPSNARMSLSVKFLINSSKVISSSKSPAWILAFLKLFFTSVTSRGGGSFGTDGAGSFGTVVVGLVEPLALAKAWAPSAASMTPAGKMMRVNFQSPLHLKSNVKGIF